MERAERPSSPLTLVALCPGCIQPVPDDAHFCSRCETPLSTTAATSYPWAAWAMGSAAGRLVHLRPPTRFLLVGTWLMAAPDAAMQFAALLNVRALSWFGRPSSFAVECGDFVVLLLARIFMIVWAGIAIVMLVRVTRNASRADAPLAPAPPREPPPDPGN